MLTENSGRDKTTEEKGREFITWKEVEALFAKERMKEGGAKNGGDNVSSQAVKKHAKSLKNKKEQGGANLPQAANSVPKNRAPRASDHAAKRVGLKRKSAEKAVKVIEKIDELIEAGENEQAKVLSVALDDNVSGAENLAKDGAMLEILSKIFSLLSRYGKMTCRQNVDNLAC